MASNRHNDRVSDKPEVLTRSICDLYQLQEQMMNKVFTVPNISCGHCVATIENELSLVEGVEAVKANNETKLVSVDVNDPIVFSVVESTLAEIGYPVGDLGAKPSVQLQM